MLTDHALLNGPRRDQQAFWLLMLCGLVILGAGLGLRDPWPADEPRFALIAKQMVESGQWLFPFRGGEIYPDKPPMFMWAIALFYSLTGSLRVAFLMPSLLAGLGTLALVFDIARRVWDRATAFRAGLLLLFTVQFTVQAKGAQIDALVTFFITLGVYGFLRFLLTDAGWRWYYLGWFAAGLGIITKGVGILAVLVLLPALWTHRQQIRAASRQAWLKALAGPLFLLLAIGLWLVPMVLAVAQHGDATYLAYRDNILFRQTVTRYAKSWHHLKPFWYYLTEVVPAFWLPLSLLLPWLIWCCRDALRQGNRAAILLMGYIVLVLLFFSLSPGKRGVYITPATPALALLAAPWLPMLLQRRWPARLWLGLAWLLAGLLTVLGVVAALHGHPKLAAVMAELGGDPWPLLLSAGVSGLVLAYLLRRAPFAAVCAVLSSLWLHWGLWGYPLMNPVRTPQGIMEQVRSTIPDSASLLIVNFREQFLLFSQRPIEHWPYLMPDGDEYQASLAWVEHGDGHRWLLAPAKVMQRCFDPAQSIALGLRHGEQWTLYPQRALLATCRQTGTFPTPFHYTPPAR